MAESTKPGSEAKSSKGRSPAYPSLHLAEALEKVKAQYETEGRYAVPLSSAFKSWGYSAKSSGGREVRASLRYFGLIVIDGDGDAAKVKLTEDALRVLLDQREDKSEKKTIVRRLALNPTSHKKLWTRFPEGIKSEPTAHHFLVFEEGFNEEAAKALIKEFKATAAYAGLYEPDESPILGDDSDEENSLGEEVSEPDHTASPPARKPLSPPLPIAPKTTLDILDGERVAFVEESQPGRYLKLIASGEVDDFMLEALEDYVKRQRKRLALAAQRDLQAQPEL